MSNITKHLPLFVICWVTNSLILYLVALAFPNYFTLGNWRFSTIIAAAISGLIWTGIVFVIEPFIKKAANLKGTTKMMVVYWVANFIALWITARLAPYFGFGTSRFVWIAALALTTDFIQYGVWRVFKSKLKY